METMIGWGVYVILMVLIQWFIIERLKKYPNKTLWFLSRVVIAAAFFWAFYTQGYWWPWIISFLVFSFWWPFNLFLNLFRGKEILYYSAENSDVDKWLLKIFRIPLVIFGFSLIAFISAVAIMYHYGLCTYWEVNHGYCQ